MPDRLRPDEPEVLGALSLMLTSLARAPVRLGAGGEMITLDEPDRSLWRKDLICEGVAALDCAVSRGRGGPCQIKAAIGALRASARRSNETDWTQIALPCNALLQHEQTPVVRLNRAVSVACSGRQTMALQELDALARKLDGYRPFHAAHARLLADAGTVAAARRRVTGQLSLP